METQIVKASLDMYIMIVRAALALTEWTVINVRSMLLLKEEAYGIR